MGRQTVITCDFCGDLIDSGEHLCEGVKLIRGRIGGTDLGVVEFMCPSCYREAKERGQARMDEFLSGEDS